MSDLLVSRRSFMKGTGAVVLAAACSGLMTGCGGGGGETSDPNEATLDDFKVNVLGATSEKREPFGGDSTETYYTFTPQIRVSYNGTGFTGDVYKNVFTAKVGETSMDFLDPKTAAKVVAAADFVIGDTIPVKINGKKTYEPEFTVSGADAYGAFENGEDIQLSVTLSGKTATYRLNKNIENGANEFKISLVKVV